MRAHFCQVEHPIAIVIIAATTTISQSTSSDSWNLKFAMQHATNNIETLIPIITRWAASFKCPITMQCKFGLACNQDDNFASWANASLPNGMPKKREKITHPKPNDCIDNNNINGCKGTIDDATTIMVYYERGNFFVACRWANENIQSHTHTHTQWFA